MYTRHSNMTDICICIYMYYDYKCMDFFPGKDSNDVDEIFIFR